SKVEDHPLPNVGIIDSPRPEPVCRFTNDRLRKEDRFLFLDTLRRGDNEPQRATLTLGGELHFLWRIDLPAIRCDEADRRGDRVAGRVFDVDIEHPARLPGWPQESTRRQLQEHRWNHGHRTANLSQALVERSCSHIDAADTFAAVSEAHHDGGVDSSLERQAV